ncbi:MMPL family transporter [Anaerovorax odorimutans]|uniref:MMPL family transporter n=1 Tax=Anaerovorax odorimutans TaxID=109327 RepID=A0ABT1RJH7_9FIRM|nr:MMPL family transporter [Anaerovorax odorimutans]MCQ4635328.1 MMPL family transporter [Anaerovorax odorimutans]
MERFFRAILSHKKTVVLIFAACAVLGAILSTGVKVNYTFADYLPEDTPSTIALKTMNEEFGSGAPNARLTVQDVSIPEALALKKKIAEIEGVRDIAWLDDAADINGPLELIEQKTLDEYYKGRKACFTLTIASDKILETYNQVREAAGEDAAMAGAAVNTAVATATTGIEVGKIMMLVIPLCFIILLLTTTSWFEPVLFMVTIGIAILINLGTNLFFGEISFVTKAACSILQLAVSMDYSIFLLHRFSGYRAEGMPVQDAMIKAIRKSFFTIAASGLTTVIGFAALILMEFRIGPDMGTVMAKAIALSMISVLVLLPVLALMSYRLIDKTQHRPLMPKFQGFAKFVNKIRVPALILFLLIMIPAFLAQSSNDFRYGAGEIFRQGTETYAERVQVEKDFGRANQLVIMVPKGDTAKEKELSNDIHQIPQVTGVLSFVDAAGPQVPPAYLDENTRSKLISDHYSRMVVTVSTNQESRDAFTVVEKLRQLGKKYYGSKYLLAGESATTYDMRDVTTRDMERVNFIAIGAIFLILLLTMRSVIIPVILVLVIETSIWINLSVPYFSGEQLQYIAYLIISAIQLGATVDYAILMASRYIEERQLYPRKQAVLQAVQNTALSILTSASILTLGGGMLGAISTNGVLIELGTLVARGAVLSAALVLLVLPAVLYLSDNLISRLTLKTDFAQGGKKHA